MAMVSGSMPSESRAPKSAPLFRNRQAKLKRIMRFRGGCSILTVWSTPPKALLFLPSVAKDCCMVEWPSAMVVCLVHISPVLKEKLTGQKRILHKEVRIRTRGIV